MISLDPVEDYQGRIDLYKLCVCRVPARPVYQTTQLEILGDSLTVQLEAHDSLLRTDLEDLDFRGREPRHVC
jgi:hypothetical protein